MSDDGFTLDGSIPTRPGLAPLSFQYRPALPVAVYQYMRAPKGTGEQEVKAVVDLLSAHLVSWDATGRNGEPVPITRETLARVAYPIQQRLIDAVTGYGGLEADAKN